MELRSQRSASLFEQKLSLGGWETFQYVHNALILNMLMFKVIPSDLLMSQGYGDDVTSFVHEG